jgi:hypothetical protein
VRPRRLQVGARGQRERPQVVERPDADAGEPLAIERAAARASHGRVERGEKAVVGRERRRAGRERHGSQAASDGGASQAQREEIDACRAYRRLPQCAAGGSCSPSALPPSRRGLETTRKTVIDPVNTAFHRHLPSAVKSRDLAMLVGLYATETGGGLGWDGVRPVHPGREEETLRWAGDARAEPIRERWARLLALFATVDKAELRIDRVGWREADATGIPADAHLLVRGTCADGRRCQLEQHAGWRIATRDGQWRITREDVTARTLVARDTPRFERVTAEAGIANVHDNTGSPVFRLFGGGSDNPIGTSAGSAVADVDGDGCEDVFLAGVDPALYRNGCDGRFVDGTADAGLPRPWPAAATSAVFFDYDNDGALDLFVAAARGGDRLFRNTGGGASRTSRRRLASRPAAGAAWARSPTTTATASSTSTSSGWATRRARSRARTTPRRTASATRSTGTTGTARSPT